MKKRYFHIRNVSRLDGWLGKGSVESTLPHGGVTISVEPANEGFVTVRYSECSLKDNFCRHTGRSFADRREGYPVSVALLPKAMAQIVDNSKRITNPSVVNFQFATKYFKD